MSEIHLVGHSSGVPCTPMQHMAMPTSPTNCQPAMRLLMGESTCAPMHDVVLGPLKYVLHDRYISIGYVPPGRDVL